MVSEMEEKKSALEQQYITLLENRVAQLQKLVKPSSSDDRDGNTSENEDGSIAARDKTGTSTSKTPLTEDNLARITNDTGKSKKSKPRVRQVISKFNEKKGLREDISAETVDQKDDTVESQCLLRNVMDISDARKISHNEIDLGSGALLELFKEVMADNDVDQSWKGQIINLHSPFVSLVHSWDKLSEAADANEPDDTLERKAARADLAKVLEFVQRSKNLEAYFKTRQSNQGSGVVSYEHLWTVFAVGTEVIATTFLEEKQIMIVGDPPVYYAEEKSQSLWCWYYDYDGSDWVVAEVEFEIDRYNGTKPIDTLPCYPLSYYNEGENTDLAKLKKGFIQRGKNFKSLCTAKPGIKQMFDYKKQMLSVERPFRSQYTNDSTDDRNSYQSYQERKPEPNAFKKASVDGRIIVDPKSFLEHAPVSLVLGDRVAHTAETKEKRYDISEEMKYLIAPPRVLGWSTVRKSWCEFLVTEIQKAREANSAIFDKELQLEAKVKKMIKALVEQHNKKDEIEEIKNPDLIEGKGRGLVILLHGPPGVGKTLTAEAISEKTGRPLLIVSVAEIGLNASRAEKNLERLFQLASRWEAILLVDEADVFLESRVSQADPNRNALVSVLLRVLEYYQGIMILTTNRINSLDVAVQSRIHLAVRYDDLSQTQMCSILKTILAKFKLEENDMDRIIDAFKDHLDDAGGIKLNGRQIRNQVFSAHAMALSDGRSAIKWQDLKVTQQFQRQLEKHSDHVRSLREASKGDERGS